MTSSSRRRRLRDSVPSGQAPAQVNVALKAVLDDAARLLEGGALVTVTNGGMRVRTLPVDAD